MRARLKQPEPGGERPGVVVAPLRYKVLRDAKILDFDLETLAAGFADPEWVPQKITVAAWSWIGSDRVYSLSTGKDGFFSRKLRAKRLKPLLAAIEKADVLTGHNIFRFDLKVLNAECIRCGLPGMKPQRVEDTIRLPRTKGLKKGQDDLSVMVGGHLKKKTMNWSEWEQAYEKDGWPEVIERCKMDVLQHKELRQKLLDDGRLKAPCIWRP